jgi:hypothetical protein
MPLTCAHEYFDKKNGTSLPTSRAIAKRSFGKSFSRYLFNIQSIIALASALPPPNPAAIGMPLITLMFK